MYDETYFQANVRKTYDAIDTAFRTVGAEALGSQDIFYRLSRMATPTVEYTEIKRIMADIDGPPLGPDEPSGHRRWPLAWGRASRRYKEIGEKAVLAGHNVTAGLNLLRASLLAHSGQMFCKPEWPEKIELQKERASCYRQAAPHLGLQEHRVPFGSHSLPGYLWLPTGVSNPPIVIMIPGANSVKEELHRWAGPLVQRGLATFTVDGPGQGELTPLQGSNLPMRLEEYHKAVTAVIDYLIQTVADRVDVKRIALWGQSLGGYLVIRSFEHEQRTIAAVSLGGPPNLNAYPFLPGDATEEGRDITGMKSFQETWDYFQKYGDGFPAAKHVRVPLLMIHGSRDDLIPEAPVRRLADAMNGNAELVVYKDGNHGIFNWDNIMTDAMADWLVDKLARKDV